MAARSARRGSGPPAASSCARSSAARCVQGQQRLQAALALLVPVSCIALLVGVFGAVNAGRDANLRATLMRQQEESHHGCNNATSILTQACEARSYTHLFGTNTYPAKPVVDIGMNVGGRRLEPSYASYEYDDSVEGRRLDHTYDNDCGIIPCRIFGVPNEQLALVAPISGCFFCIPGEACGAEDGDVTSYVNETGITINVGTPDQCVSSVLGGANPRFAISCLPPATANQSAGSASDFEPPAWCNCTSAAFSALARGSPFCELEAATLNALYVDVTPARPMFSGGTSHDADATRASAQPFSYRDQSGRRRTVVDTWDDTLGGCCRCSTCSAC